MKTRIAHKWYWLAGLLAVVAIAMLLFRHEITSGLMTAYRLITDREKVELFIAAFGDGAPVAFMTLQVLQVILAPVPGEATGFIGGYLFGAFKGFIYSTLALSVGSWINFSIGRYVGRRYVRRWIPPKTLDRFDRLVQRQGVIALFIMFVFPGFPKDYLCLFLGMTALPLNVFLVMASIGRMPGTLMLSLQGEFLFNQNYVVFTLIMGLTLVVALVSVRYRETIYRWLETLNRKPDRKR